MPQVPRPAVLDRAQRLREKGVLALQRHLDGEIGAKRRVLAERGGVGYTEQFTQVRLDAASPVGVLRDVTIAGHDGHCLIAA